MSPKQSLFQSKNLVSLSIFLVFFLLSTFIILFEKPEVSGVKELQIGEPAPRDIFAPISFTVPNLQATEKLRESAFKKALPAYSLNTQLVNEKESWLGALIHGLSEIKNGSSKEDIKKISAAYHLDPREITILLKNKKWKEEAVKYQKLFSEELKAGILNNSLKEHLLDTYQEIVTLDKSERIVRTLKEIPSQKEILSKVHKQLQRELRHNKKVQKFWFQVAEKTLVPTLQLNEVETEKWRKKLIDETPPIMDLVKRNQILAEKGKIITRADYTRIENAARQIAKRKAISTVLAKALLIFAAFGMFAGFLYLFESGVFLNLKNLLLLNSAIFLTLFLERIAFLMPEDLIYFTLPASLAALLLSLLMNYRMALVGTLMVVVLTSVMSSFRPDIILFSLFGGFAGLIATVGLKKRSQFIKAGILIGLVNCIVIFSYWFFNNVSLQGSLQLGGLGFANGLLMAFLIFFIVVFFERGFKVTTDITLLELSDLNHPLLKQMVMRAPGTYHHTLMLANLCEAAAEAINANSLLARVGCYFHDIGKIATPEYFIENESIQNPQAMKTEKGVHEKIPAVRSRDIIIDHVKRGLELGKKCRLPEVILDFIPEHHGTGLVYYFYHKAKKEAEPNSAPVREKDFRYPGGKPKTKETAITLLADSVEATVRTLPDHSRENIMECVKRIVNEKFTDGQLDACPLTLKDLEMIAESFTRTLSGVYHSRIKYPKQDEKKDKPKPFSD